MARSYSPRQMPEWMRWVERQLRTLDAFRQDTIAVPVGGLVLWGGTGTPPGFLRANGATFDPVTYPELADVLGGTTLPSLAAVSGLPWIVRAE